MFFHNGLLYHLHVTKRAYSQQRAEPAGEVMMSAIALLLAATAFGSRS